MSAELVDSNHRREGADSNGNRATEGSHILVVDDDPMVNSMVSTVLKRSGYRVDTADDGEQGWNAIRAQQFDLLITDYSMPKLDGLALLRRVRSNSLPLPAILMSAAMPLNIGEIMELVTPDGALHKPFGIKDLLYKVGTLLGEGQDSLGPAVAGPSLKLAATRAKARTPSRRAAHGDMQGLATRLLDLESAPAALERGEPVIFAVCDKLRRPLRDLTGGTGFRSILSHALALSRLDVAWLWSVEISAEGFFKGLRQAEAPLDEFEIVRGETVFVTQVLGLLFAFLGEYMTQMILEDIWQGVGSGV